MIINLPWVEPINTQNLPENLEELVKKSFREFTKGTRKEYQHEDKLMYLDNLRRAYLREDNTEKAVRNLVSGETMYYLEEYGEMRIQKIFYLWILWKLVIKRVLDLFTTITMRFQEKETAKLFPLF